MFTTNLVGVEPASVVFLAVGTPPKADGSADPSFVNTAAIDVARNIRSYKVVAMKSTVPVGTGKRLTELIKKNLPAPVPFSVVSNPEFLREGAAISDFMRPDRVVIGSGDKEATEVMRELYRPLYLIETPFVITSVEGAELTKYAANAFLATKISFINEIANLCERVGCDVHDVARAIGMDRRIGSKFLHPGPGFGGSCFPKDTRALSVIGRVRSPTRIVVRGRSNSDRRQAISEDRKAGWRRKRSANSFLGVVSTRDDDMREAPGRYHRFCGSRRNVGAYDPVAQHEAGKNCAGY